MKSGDFFRAWGGVAGIQSTLAVLLEQGHHRRGLPLEKIAALLAAHASPAIPNRQQRERNGRQRCRPGPGGSRPSLYTHGRGFTTATSDQSVRRIRVPGRRPFARFAAVRRSFQMEPLRRARAASWYAHAARKLPRLNRRRMHQLGQTRSVQRHDHLLQTPDSFVRAPLPCMWNATAIVHVTPILGARFTEYTAEFETEGRLEAVGEQRFVYVLEGELQAGSSTLRSGDLCLLARRKRPVPRGEN